MVLIFELPRRFFSLFVGFFSIKHFFHEKVKFLFFWRKSDVLVKIVKENNKNHFLKKSVLGRTGHTVLYQSRVFFSHFSWRFKGSYGFLLFFVKKLILIELQRFKGIFGQENIIFACFSRNLYFMFCTYPRFDKKNNDCVNKTHVFPRWRDA